MEYPFSQKNKHAIFFIGVVGLALVPVFHSLTGLPPFVGVLALLSILWIFTEIVIRRNKRQPEPHSQVRVSDILRKIDMSTILFFLGILFAVGALGKTGTLTLLGQWLNTAFQEDIYAINSIIGILSSVVDNVPLVASAMGMYTIEPSTATGVLQNFAQDGDFWNLLAYCAGTGGSILIIGSAAGVVIMGLEEIPEFGIGRLKEHKLFSILNIVSFQSLRFVVKEAICSQCCDHIHDEVVDRPVP